jgi:hypothetical protein
MKIPIQFESYYLTEGKIFAPPAKGVTIEAKEDGEIPFAANFGDLRIPKEANKPYGTRSNYIRLWQALKQSKWIVREDTTGLLSDFLKLAHASISPDEIHKFILKWGPLWLCLPHTQGGGDHLPCIWTPAIPGSRPVVEEMFQGGLIGGTSLVSSPCTWMQYESFDRYTGAARIIALIVAIYNHIVREKNKAAQSAPLDLWDKLKNSLTSSDSNDLSYLFPDPFPTKAADQRMIMSLVINSILARYNVNNTVLYCGEDSKYSLRYNEGWGFFRSMLMELFKVITREESILQCAVCRVRIFPEERKRKPKKGQYSYCTKHSSSRSMITRRKP